MKLKNKLLLGLTFSTPLASAMLASCNQTQTQKDNQNEKEDNSSKTDTSDKPSSNADGTQNSNSTNTQPSTPNSSNDTSSTPTQTSTSPTDNKTSEEQPKLEEPKQPEPNSPSKSEEPSKDAENTETKLAALNAQEHITINGNHMSIEMYYNSDVSFGNVYKEMEKFVPQLKQIFEFIKLKNYSPDLTFTIHYQQDGSRKNKDTNNYEHYHLDATNNFTYEDIMNEALYKSAYDDKDNNFVFSLDYFKNNFDSVMEDLYHGTYVLGFYQPKNYDAKRAEKGLSVILEYQTLFGKNGTETIKE